MYIWSHQFLRNWYAFGGIIDALGVYGKSKNTKTTFNHFKYWEKYGIYEHHFISMDACFARIASDNIKSHGNNYYITKGTITTSMIIYSYRIGTTEGAITTYLVLIPEGTLPKEVVPSHITNHTLSDSGPYLRMVAQLSEILITLGGCLRWSW